MPDFILDVQGLEKTFKIPEGVTDAVHPVSFELTIGKTFSRVGESSNPGFAMGVIDVKEDHTMLPFVNNTASLFVKAPELSMVYRLIRKEVLAFRNHLIISHIATL